MNDMAITLLIDIKRSTIGVMSPPGGGPDPEAME